MLYTQRGQISYGIKATSQKWRDWLFTRRQWNVMWSLMLMARNLHLVTRLSKNRLNITSPNWECSRWSHFRVWMDVGWLVCWLCLTSHRQLGHYETAPSFNNPCEGREAWFLHRPHRESNPGSLRGSPLHNRCATPAPRKEDISIWWLSIGTVASIQILTYEKPHVLIINSRHTFVWL